MGIVWGILVTNRERALSKHKDLSSENQTE